MPVACLPVGMHLRAKPGSLVSVHSHQAAATAVWSPLTLLFPRQNKPIALHFHSYALCSCSSHHGDPWLDSFLYVSICPLLGALTWGGHTRSDLVSAEHLGRIPSPCWCSPACGGCFAAPMHCCLLAMLCPTTISGSFLQSCSQMVGPSLFVAVHPSFHPFHCLHTQPLSHWFGCKESTRVHAKDLTKVKVYNTCCPPLCHTATHVTVENSEVGWAGFALAMCVLFGCSQSHPNPRGS